MARAMSTGSLRLGHIVYSNCFPVHARLVDAPRAGDPVLVEGIPSRLNGLLERGEIDVAPCSSIEFARYGGRYRVLPELVIGSRGAVRSIKLLSDRHPTELGGLRVGLPTASATSVVLLKVLLRVRWRATPDFFWFDQAREDPFAAGASAALFIGDVALTPGLYPAATARLDLGEEWWEETGLPFAFAIWQAASDDRASLRELHGLLLESRAYGAAHRSELAARYADRFGLPAAMLDRYWADLAFELDAPMLEGLGTFYRLAAEIGEIEAAPELRWI